MKTTVYLWPENGQWHVEELGGLGIFGTFSTEMQARKFIVAVLGVDGVTVRNQRLPVAA